VVNKVIISEILENEMNYILKSISNKDKADLHGTILGEQ
jgi:hypothetical protein